MDLVIQVAPCWFWHTSNASSVAFIITTTTISLNLSYDELKSSDAAITAVT